MAIKCDINQSVGEIVWSRANGEAVTLHIERLSDAVKSYATFHGLKQRGSDVMAISRNTDTGLPATEDEKFNELRGIVEFYESGTADWSRRAGGGGGRRSDSAASILIMALVRLGRDEAKVKAKVEGLTKGEIAALSQHPTVKPQVDAILAERSAGVDAEELLSDL
jgi:hypothetical protein